jgi:hypothetical protein
MENMMENLRRTCSSLRRWGMKEEAKIENFNQGRTA